MNPINASKVNVPPTPAAHSLHSSEGRGPLGVPGGGQLPIHVARAAKFSSALAAASSTDELDSCFLFPVLVAKAPVSGFYEFFGL